MNTNVLRFRHCLPDFTNRDYIHVVYRIEFAESERKCCGRLEKGNNKTVEAGI